MIALLLACGADPGPPLVPVAAALGEGTGGASPPATEGEEPACHVDLPATAAAAGSLYDLDLDLDTASGERVKLGLHRGHPVLLSMVYASCTDVCPATVTLLKSIEARVPPERLGDLRVLLVSLDPARDDVAALAGLRDRHELGLRWTVARAEADQVRELAAALGVRYRPRADGGIDHSTVVALLDEEGVVEARLDALGQPADALLEAIGGR